jgi:hypothetical protein
MIISAFVAPLYGIISAILDGPACLKTPSQQFFDAVGPVVYTVAGLVDTILGATWAEINRQWLGVAESVIGKHLLRHQLPRQRRRRGLLHRRSHHSQPAVRQLSPARLGGQGAG